MAVAGEMANALNELVSLEMEIHTKFALMGKLTSEEEANLKDKIGEWLKKAQELAEEFKPREWTIGVEVGFPPKVSASFTWSGSLKQS